MPYVKAMKTNYEYLTSILSPGLERDSRLQLKSNRFAYTAPFFSSFKNFDAKMKSFNFSLSV